MEVERFENEREIATKFSLKKTVYNDTEMLFIRNNENNDSLYFRIFPFQKLVQVMVAIGNKITFVYFELERPRYIAAMLDLLGFNLSEEDIDLVLQMAPSFDY